MYYVLVLLRVLVNRTTNKLNNNYMWVVTLQEDLHMHSFVGGFRSTIITANIARAFNGKNFLFILLFCSLNSNTIKQLKCKKICNVLLWNYWTNSYAYCENYTTILYGVRLLAISLSLVDRIINGSQKTSLLQDY